MQPNTSESSFAIKALLVFFIVAPLISWFIVPHHSNSSSRSTEEFYKLIQTYNRTESHDQQVPDVTIKSVKRVKDVWYVLTVVTKEPAHESDKMLVADFYHDPKKMTILSLPFEVALQKNISGIGVPYTVIDELNPNLEDGANE